MITNNGKKLIAKFLLNQVPNYATHIAAGCGPQSATPSQTLTPTKMSEISVKTNLDFEVFRVPISAKGIVNENGVDKIVFKAEAPTEQRYQITEVGFFSAANNTLAGAFDSKSLFTFTPTESWVITDGSSSSAISTITDNSLISDGSSNFILSSPANFIISNASTFDQIVRKDRQESPRIQGNALILSGSSSFINSSASVSGYRIENSGINLNLSQNLPDDEIRLAMCVASRQASNNTNPVTVRVLLQFFNSPTMKKAQKLITLSSADFIDSESSTTNRYKILYNKISTFTADTDFSWGNIDLIRIYASVLNSSNVPTSDYLIIFDGMRLENNSIANPLYSLVGYDLVKEVGAYPILKTENTNNYIEYRFEIGIDNG